MRTGFVIAVGLAACVVASAPAQAQSTKGSGKAQVTIIKWPVVNPQAKAAGSVQSKPAASVALKAPTGGGLTKVKLAKDLGIDLKPGYGAGEYVLDIETGATPDGDVTVHAYVTLSVDSAFKCTVNVAETAGDTNAGQCGGVGQPICAPTVPGKCQFTTYQAAGVPNYLLGPGDGQPTASRMRLRVNPDPNNCKTGDILLAGSPLPPSSVCSTGTVVGVMGVANGDVDPN